jgi:ribosomal protein S18 acetylase RimI-like enzyme
MADIKQRVIPVLNKMAITVSKLDESDREQWETLYYRYADFYDVPMDVVILDTIWSWIFEKNSQFFALIAKNESGNALGFAHCREMPSPLRGGFVGFLDDLYVMPKSRGTGCVQSLYKELNQLGKERGWPFVRWITAENNYRGRASYDKVAEKTQWLTYQMPVV